jgi:hypothetical protein
MILGFRLNPIQALIIAVLLGVLFVAGFAHWGVVARASRLKDDDGGGGRLFPFGLGTGTSECSGGLGIQPRRSNSTSGL